MADEWDLKLSDLLSNCESRFAIVVSRFKIGEWCPYFEYLIQSHHTGVFLVCVLNYIPCHEQLQDGRPRKTR